MSNIWLPGAFVLLAGVAAVLGVLVYRASRPPAKERRWTVAIADGQQNRIALALRASNDGLWHWDMRTSALRFSPRVYELLAREVGEVELHIEVFGKLVHPVDRRRARGALVDHWRGSDPFQGEYRLRLSSGVYRWFRLRGQTLRDSDGEALQMAGSITDVNEQRRRDHVHSAASIGGGGRCRSHRGIALRRALMKMAEGIGHSGQPRIMSRGAPSLDLAA